jgi:hypothetical protein
MTPLWLQSLIKAQAVMDSGVRLAARHEAELRGGRAACREGCFACCASRAPRATAVEMAGVRHALARDASPGAARAKERLLSETSGRGCPLLVDGRCAAYAMRFLSCRSLVVFGRACQPGEQPSRTRPGDLLTPHGLHAVKAYSLILAHLEGGLAPRGAQAVVEALARHKRPVASFGACEMTPFDGLARHAA